jgi:hypothetical protein
MINITPFLRIWEEHISRLKRQEHIGVNSPFRVIYAGPEDESLLLSV